MSIDLILGTFVFFIVLFSFVRIKIGIALYLAYLLLVPYMRLHIGDLTLSYNLANLLILIAFFVEYSGRHSYNIDYKPLVPFAFLYIGYLFSIFLSSDTPLMYMFNFYRQDIMKIFILPFVMWNIILHDASSLRLYRNVFFVAIAIATIYGLYLTDAEGFNPYIIELKTWAGEEYNINYFANDERMFGRISSVFIHPMSFGLFLGLSMILLFSYLRKINLTALLPLMFLVIINVFTCGVRSVIAGLGFAMLFYLLMIRRFKIFLGASIMMAILWWGISYVPEMSSYVMSIADKSSSNVGGSSLELRLSQLHGCLVEIKNNFLFGKGFDWNRYYLTTRGNHPQIIAFESLIFVVLCNFGMFGVLLWLFYIYKMFVYIRKLGSLQQTISPMTLFVFYLSYSCITGEYEYMHIFILFYIIMIGEIRVSFDTNKSKKRYLMHTQLIR